MIRIVLDTNVLISTALPRSRLKKLVMAWQNHRCAILVSPEIFDEYLRVLTYPKFRLSTEDIKRILEKDLLPFTQKIEVKNRVDVIVDDPSDNKFLACALDGRADFIVSGDRHLLSLKSFQGIPILTARQFLDRLND